MEILELQSSSVTARLPAMTNFGETRNDDGNAMESRTCAEAQPTVLATRGLTLNYSAKTALRNVSITLPGSCVTALIGPSGCGKSSLLRCFNRMNDLIDGAKVSGEVLYQGINVNSTSVDPIELRKQVGMVFQKSTPFPTSIAENVLFGARIHGLVRERSDAARIVEENLRAVALWDEVKDRLKESALSLSGGQQQRLCIARSLAVQPTVLLMDEPCSALDPISTAKIEELIAGLKQRYTIVIVTHNLQQAGRVADFVGFMLNGELVEFNSARQLFSSAADERTSAYVSGRFG